MLRFKTLDFSIVYFNVLNLLDNTTQAGMHTHYLQILALSPE